MTSIRLPSGAVIDDCEWLIESFVKHDAYEGYDYYGSILAEDHDRLTDRQLYAMNSAMMAPLSAGYCPSHLTSIPSIARPSTMRLSSTSSVTPALLRTSIEMVTSALASCSCSTLKRYICRLLVLATDRLPTVRRTRVWRRDGAGMTGEGGV